MSLQPCQAGDTSGFPVRLAQSLYTNWPSTDKSQEKLRKLFAPTDFTVQWGPPAQSAQITVTNDKTHFQIRGIDTVANATTLTLGSAIYSCSSVLSIVQAQHRNYSQDPNAAYEVILAFQIRNKSLNPSAPDIILMCRPIVFSNYNTSPFWDAVNKAAQTGNAQSTSLDMSTMYGYNQTTPMPMITYRTCLPVKLLNYKGAEPVTGSISVRVHVVPQPIYMVGGEDGTGKCSVVSKYIFVTEPKRLVDMFDGSASNTVFQFRDGLGEDLYPTSVRDNFTPLQNPTPISAFQDVIQKFEILMPEAFLGKSLAEIAATGTPAPPPKKQKAYKCYRINPERDIKNGEILIDPKTGQKLSKVLRDKQLEDAGYDSSMLDGISTDDMSSGLMPGDIEQILVLIFIGFGSLALLAYFMYIIHTLFFRHDLRGGLINLGIFLLLLAVLVVCAILFTGGSKPDPSKSTDLTVPDLPARASDNSE
jgi:hypothetical protein